MTFLDHAKKVAKVLESANEQLALLAKNPQENQFVIETKEALTSANALVELLENGGWMPIEKLKLKQFNGYAVSEPVLMAIWFDETRITNIKSGRVWEQDGRRSLPDNKHDVYERVTHWMPLPTPPKAKE